MYCIFLKFTVRLAVQSACSTYLFIVLRVLCCTLCSVLCVWIIFGYVWVYYVISPVDIECEWLQINSEIANQLCPSLRIKMTVSKLYLYCACSVLFLSLFLPQSLRLYSFFFIGLHLAGSTFVCQI